MKHFKYLVIILFVSFSCQQQSEKDYELIVYGGTSSGVMAAYAASAKGTKVLLVEPGLHLGGLSSSGLGETDIGNKYTVTGLSRDFYRRLGKYYGKFEAWRFEPHVAEQIYGDYIKNSKVEVLYMHRLHSLEKKGTEITSITLENTENPEQLKSFSAKVFIDASYEGDLLAKAGVSFHIGREGNLKYGEQLNGVGPIVKSNQLPDGIDPYIRPGDHTSGLIWGVSDQPLGEVGSPDNKVQAYNYRLCMTSDTANMIPISRPEGYDPTIYEGLRRIIQQREEADWIQRIPELYLRVSPMPNFKTDINNKGGFSTDLIGGNWEYPEASYMERKGIEQKHKAYIEGLIYFLAYDPDIPQHIKDQMLKYGWPKDEFQDNGGFPHQIYVREARRMVSDFVMTEHHVRGKKIIEDTIAMGAYNLDSHHADRHVVNGMVKNEGEFQEKVDPYAISLRVLIPKKTECTNLLVSACISASHVAYGSIRMEPVFMMLGQASGIVAYQAVSKGKSVQEVDGVLIKKLLKEDPLVNGHPPEIVLNNEDPSVNILGEWEVSTKKYTDHYYLNYLASSKKSNKEARVILETMVANQGTYEVFYYITGVGREHVRRAKEVPISIANQSNENNVTVDMSSNLGSWVSIGTFTFSAGKVTITVEASGIDEEVVADAVILQKKKLKLSIEDN